MKKYLLLILIFIGIVGILYNKQLWQFENEKFEALQEQIEKETPEKMA